MRQLERTWSTGSKTILNVVEHIILRNGWEYYVTDQFDADTPDIKLCLVMGHETELGDVYMPELKPYIISRTKNLNILPAEEWEWSDKKESEE